MKKLKKYKMAIIPLLIVVILGIALIILVYRNKNIKQNLIDTAKYTLKYDETWKVKESTDTTATLEHDDNGQIKLSITTVDENYQYSEISEMIDEIIYSINQNNPDYTLLKNEQKTLTIKEYNAYRLLYENAENQILITVFKVGENLVTITYEAENEYFDILLDSANTIIDSFEMKSDTLELTQELNIETQNLQLGESTEVDNLLTDTQEVEVASNNYCVNFNIPTAFVNTDFDSTLPKYKLNFTDTSVGSINLTATVYNRNIYEAITTEGSLNLLSTYNYKDQYEDFEDSLDTIEKNGYNGYVYKSSYSYDSSESNKNENVLLIYSLDESHIFVATLTAYKVSISDKLINMIQINTIKNYSSYVTSTKENGVLTGILKRFVGTNKESTEQITLKLPETYSEQDVGRNIYEYRKFAKDYNENLEIYNYEVEYTVTTMKEDSIKESKDSSLSTQTAYGPVSYTTKQANKILNGKEFSVYTCSVTQRSGIMYTNINRTKYTANTMILVYQLENGGVLEIEVTGNDKEITDEILNEITNFDVENI